MKSLSFSLGGEKLAEIPPSKEIMQREIDIKELQADYKQLKKDNIELRREIKALHAQNNIKPIEIKIGEAEKLLTIRKAANLLSVCRSTVYILLKQGDLTRAKIGKRALITRQSIEELIERSIK